MFDNSTIKNFKKSNKEQDCNFFQNIDCKLENQYVDSYFKNTPVSQDSYNVVNDTKDNEEEVV